MKRFMLVLIVPALIAVSLSLDAQQAAPDIILTNGKIITVAQFSIAQAVAVRGDRFVRVGTNQEIYRLAGPTTRRIDLRGRVVVPGLIDNHAHFQEEGAYWMLELRLDGVDSRKQVLEMIRAKAKEKGPGRWVYNPGGWSPDQFTEDKRPFTRDELDRSVLARQPGVPTGQSCGGVRQQQSNRGRRARQDEPAVDRAPSRSRASRRCFTRKRRSRLKASFSSWKNSSGRASRSDRYAGHSCTWKVSPPRRSTV